ncbi:hypothetical protein ACFL3X_01740 [Gemmatimonadota bacterium]
MRPTNHLLSITLVALLSIQVACDNPSNIINPPDPPDPPELNPSQYIVTEVFESLSRVARVSLGNGATRDTYIISSDGQQKIEQGATLDFTFFVFTELPQAHLSVQLNDSQEWVSFIDFEDSLPWGTIPSGSQFWHAWIDSCLPSIQAVIQDSLLVMEYVNVVSLSIRVVQVKSSVFGPRLPMSTQYYFRDSESEYIETQDMDIYTLSSGTITDYVGTGGNLQPTVSAGFIWWMSYDGSVLHWIDPITHSTGDIPQSSNRIGMVGRGESLFFGLKSSNSIYPTHYVEYYAPALIAGYSEQEAVLDTFIINQPMVLTSSLTDSLFFGILRYPANEGIQDVLVGIIDVNGSVIEQQVVPFHDILGVMYGDMDVAIASRRIVRDAVGVGGGNNLNYVNVFPRLWIMRNFDATLYDH